MSRDPKCSGDLQEAGTLALDRLHRQVLPFLLRRMKEDVLDDLPPKIIQVGSPLTSSGAELHRVPVGTCVDQYLHRPLSAGLGLLL